jgi:hypothetical protein
LFRLIPGFILVESLLKIETDRALTQHAELAYYQIALVRCDYPGRSIRPLRNHAPRRIGVPKRVEKRGKAPVEGGAAHPRGGRICVVLIAVAFLARWIDLHYR